MCAEEHHDERDEERRVGERQRDDVADEKLAVGREGPNTKRGERCAERKLRRVVRAQQDLEKSDQALYWWLGAGGWCLVA